MKHIIKSQEPIEFTQWKDQANENWKPNFVKLAGKPKQSLTQSLKKEQGYLCCYCENRLIENDCHIEHFRPQDGSTNDLDYFNLFCSCQVNLKKREPRHCGNLKGNWFDANLLVSPLDSNCENRFIFTVDGQILAAHENDLAAKTTIEKLGLNLPKLINLRKSVIDPFIDSFLDETFSDKELKIFVEDYLSKNSEGEYGVFWRTIDYLFRKNPS